MKHITSFLLTTLFLTLAAQAQESAFNRYFEERARGDAAANDSRAEFAKAVCESAISTFCPGFKRDSNKLCSDEQKRCGSPVTIVVNRFISKYGVGLTSAERDVVPALKRLFQVMKEIDTDTQNKNQKISTSVQTRLPFISMTTALSSKEVKSKFSIFTEKYFPKKLKTIKIDYWGYFQQQKPGRPQFTFNEADQSASLTVNFRWCSSQKRFIDESKHLVGDVLASAIMNPGDIPNFISADDYQKKCDSLPMETADATNK